MTRNPSVEPSRFREMFDYLSAPEGDKRCDGAFVFGRADTRLVDRIVPALGWATQYALITGGIGKDSGDLALPSVRITEADYLAILVHERGVPLKRLLVERHATNGAENARFGLEMIRGDERQLTFDSLLVIAHATSSRRLTETLKLKASKGEYPLERIATWPTDYYFDAWELSDQLEAAQEVKRLVEWPAKGWLGLVDVPEAIAEYAIEIEPVLEAKQ